MADPYYRFYDLDHRGAITGASNRAFTDAAAALAHADQLLAHRPGVEVWQTDRLVGRRDGRGRRTGNRDQTLALSSWGRAPAGVGQRVSMNFVIASRRLSACDAARR